MSDGRLYVCATPIGNLGDVSDRLRATLKDVDLVFAEDTRRSAALLAHVGASPPMRSLFVGNERARTAELVDAVADGKRVALISDAGVPTVSDPGAEAIRKIREAGLGVTMIPGPSAVTSAVTLAGFGADRFAFEGFLPRKGRERGLRLEKIGTEDRPVVLFVSPNRLVGDLQAIADEVGEDREVAVARELTKIHEEVWIGSIGAAIEEWTDREPRGEFTVVVAPGAPRSITMDEAVTEARRLVEEGESLSSAARTVSESSGLSRREVYQALLTYQSRS